MHLRTRPLFALAAAITGLMAGLACTAILNPRDDVERCGSADDCPSTNDGRFVSVCRFDPGSDLDSTEFDQICVADFRDVTCNPMNYTDPTHPYAMALADFGLGRYIACEDPMRGAIGCPPPQGTFDCNAGLMVNEDGLCDDQDDSTPMARSLVGMSELFGLDVQDQFCRSTFCRDNWACVDGMCAECDPSLPFGEGGCGDVYINGAKSCIYQDQNTLDANCLGPGNTPDVINNGVTFGPCM